MRQQFREFYFDKDDKEIWEDSVIVLDTNVLLNLYRYTKETSDQILNLLQKYKDNLWMPHQVALEYHYNRKSVIVEQSGSYKKVCDAFNAIPEEIRNSLNKDLSIFKKRHKEDVDSFFKNIKSVTDEQIRKLKERNEKELDLTKEDTIKNKITDLYLNKVGKPYDKSSMENLEKEADVRLKKNIPPGYKDFDKKKESKFHNGVVIQNKYGDLILWKQLLDFAEDKKVNIIFLTDEQKEDWWYDIKNKIIGPRIELLNEFTFVTNKEFHMFSSIGFVERHSNDVNETAVSEVREVTKEYKSKNEMKMLYRQLADDVYRERIKKKFMAENHRDTEKENMWGQFAYDEENFEEDAKENSGWKKHNTWNSELDKRSILEFCFWFRNNEAMFNKLTEDFGRFHMSVENALGSHIADNLMRHLSNLNITELNPYTGRLGVNIDKLQRYVYGYLGNKEN
ncbi:PIN-like domain-containing protein [Bacillus pumilus]|uniref:PIN-like domain-containing protein n=1 Tax=Bacillus pumilus TaxID=1408 RepID=UPI003C296694